MSYLRYEVILMILMFVFCSLTLWQPRQLRQLLEHLWALMVSTKQCIAVTSDFSWSNYENG